MRPLRSMSSAALVLLAVACGDNQTSPTGVAEPSVNRASTSETRAVQAASLGAYRFSVAPEVFGTTTPIDNLFVYNAEKSAGGAVSGHVLYVQSADGSTFRYTARITCMNIYDYDGRTGNRAKIGALIETSTDPDAPAGKYLWWQAIDGGDGAGAVDKSTLIGVGDQVATDAFCNSSNVPRFGPFPVVGVLVVKSR